MKRIIAYKGLFQEFVEKRSHLEQQKIRRALALLKQDEKIPSHYIKYIEQGVLELRISHCGNEFRIFFMYDGEEIIVLFNSFHKKTQKTPRREIEMALKLKKEYYEAKRNRQGHL